MASAQVGNLTPGLPVRTDASHNLVGGLIQLADCNFAPLVNPFVGNLQATQFTQSGQPVANVSQITLANAGAGSTLVSSATAPLAVKSITAGSNITFTSTATDIKIDSTNALVTLASAGGVETLVNDGIGPVLATKGLTAGAGITLTATATAITVVNTDPGSAVSLASAGGVETLVNDGVGPALATKGITAGSGISLTATATAITVANTDPGSAVSLASAGGVETLVNDGVGPALATKGITAGSGISLTATATQITVANTDPGSAVSLASAGGVETLVNDGVGPALATKGLTAGAGISLTGAATAITVANTDPGSSVTLASAGGTVSLVNDGVGPALAVRGLTAGTGITITSDAVSATVAAAGSTTATLARADATSYAVSASATRDLWALATGQGGNTASSQAYIPSINRIVAGGNGAGNGAIYSDDGGATWIAATTIIASSGVVGYSSTLGVVTWRAGTEVRTSTDNGVNYTLQAPFAASSGVPILGPILWASFLGLFVAADGSTIATSPDGITWTLRPSASRGVRRIIAVGTTLVTCGDIGQMTSTDGINWVNASATPTLWCDYSPELKVIAYSPLAGSTTMYTSADFGVTLTPLVVAPNNASYRGFVWSSTLGGFIMPQTGFAVGEVNIYLWPGDSRPFAGGLANGLIVGSGTGGGGTAVYCIYEYPVFRRLSIAVNALGSVWTTKYLQTTSSIAASGAGSLSGQALYLASGVVQPTWAASKAQLYLDSATQELRHRFNNVNYPLAGVNVLKTARFDGTLSQTLYNDGVILFNWDGINKQVRMQIAATPWFTATGFEATQYYSFSAAMPLTQANEALAYTAATNYYLSSAAVARTLTNDMNKTTPMTVSSSVWPSTGVVATTPYYEIEIRLSPSFAGNYTVQKIYTP